MMRILLPTDYSEHAFHAAAYAARLMGVENVSYFLVHTYMDADPSVTAWGNMAEELYKAASDGMVHWEGRIRGSAAFHGAKLAKEVVFGPLTGVLNEIARDKAADLVVMGTQGRSGGGLLGSNAAGVVKHSRVPVLVVPANAPLTGVDRILFADDQRRVKAEDLKMLLHIALRTRSEVVLAHVLRNAEEVPRPAVVSLFDELFQAIPHRFAVEEGQDVAGTIDMLAERESAGMIAVLHRHAGFFEDLFRFSTAKRLALHTNLPLLVLQHQGSGDEEIL